MQKYLGSGFMKGTGPVNAACAEKVLLQALVEPLDTTRIPRVAGRTGDRTVLVTTRPCRAPHHLGCGADRWGQVPMPGEVSLPIMVCSSSMSFPSSSGLSSKSCGSPSRRAFYKYNLPRITDLMALGALAARMRTTMGSKPIRSQFTSRARASGMMPQPRRHPASRA